MRANPADSERDDTHLARWYSDGTLSEAHYNALVAWRDDGGGVKRPKVAGAKGKREDDGDHHRENARMRHRQIWRRMDQINQDAAQACRRLVMINDPDVRTDHVQIGASVCWAEYFGGR